MSDQASETPWPARPSGEALDSCVARLAETRQVGHLLSFVDRFEFLPDDGSPTVLIRFADVLSGSVDPAPFRYRPPRAFRRLSLLLSGGKRARFIIGAMAAENVRAIYERGAAGQDD